MASLAWLGIVAWSFLDPTVGLRIAPFLEIVIRLSAPLVLVVGLAIFVMMLAGHWDNDGSETRLSSEEAREAATQAAQAAARIADAHSQMLSQTKAYAAAADRSATMLRNAVSSMAEQSDQLSRTTAASVEALSALTERMDAFDETAPRVEQRPFGAHRDVDGAGRRRCASAPAISKRASRMRRRAAGHTRDELIAAGDSLNSKLGTLRDGAKAAGEELTGLSELSSARIDFTLDRVKTVLDATELRIEVQNEALTRLVDRSRDSIETAGQQSLDRFLAHCKAIEATLETLDTRIARQSETGSAWLESAAPGRKRWPASSTRWRNPPSAARSGSARR